MYGLFAAPYGKARPIYEDDFTTAIEAVNNRINGLDEQIAQRQTELTLMWNGKSNFDEKHDFSVKLQNEISRLAAEKRDYIDMRAQINAYISIWRYARVYTAGANSDGEKAPFYFGIECDLSES
jgi:hypothetical protein